MTNPRFESSRPVIDVRGLVSSLPAHSTVLVGRSQWRRGDRPVIAGHRRLRMLERVLDAVGECVVEAFLVAATSAGVRVRKIDARVEAEVPVPDLPGAPRAKIAGPERIRVVLLADTDANALMLGRLIVEARNTSPVFDMVTSGVRVEVVHGTP